MGARVKTFILGLISVSLCIPMMLALIDKGEQMWVGPYQESFTYGSITGFILGIVIAIKLPVLMILEHELTHLMVALLMFRKPVRVVADSEGGETEYTGRGSVFIRLAPYILPSTTLIALGLLALFKIDRSAELVFFLALTWGCHLSTGLVEASPRQTDLREGGLLVSYVTVLSLCAVIYPATAIASYGNWQIVGEWALRAWEIIMQTKI